MNLAEKRQMITEQVCKTFDILDPTKTNSNNFHEKFDSMSDAQFIAYFKTLVANPKTHLYFEIEAFKDKREPSFDIVEKAADFVGEKYCKIYDYIAFPHLSDDPSKPVVTTNKIFNGYINMRRVQQIVNHKTHIPTDNDKRDPKTGQVTQESKAARVSDAEHFGMICQGMPNVLKEMFGPRGGDAVMRSEMEQAIASGGSVTLGELTDSKVNKTSLNTANVYYLAAALETDLITKNGVLPRTLFDMNKDAKTLKRNEGNNDGR